MRWSHRFILHKNRTSALPQKPGKKVTGWLGLISWPCADLISRAFPYSLTAGRTGANTTLQGLGDVRMPPDLWEGHKGVSSQVKWAKFRHKVYQFWGGVSPESIPAEKLVCNGLVVLEPVAGAGHVNNLTAVDEAVKDSGGNGGVAEEVGPPVKPLVGSNNQ